MVKLFAAQQVTVSVVDLALANMNVVGIYPTTASLTIDEILLATGDSLATLGPKLNQSGYTVSAIAAANLATANLFAPSSALYIEMENPNTPPASGDTIPAGYAANNHVSVDALATYNTGAALQGGAVLALPATVVNTSAQQFAIYAAQPNEQLSSIAALFPNSTPETIAALNPDTPGLFVAGQPVGSVTTDASSTFASLAAALNQTIAQVAQSIAAQGGLIAQGSVWICPPMTAANSNNSLSGLASKFA